MNGKQAVEWTWVEALSGVVPPLISPLDAAGAPDEAAVRRLVEHTLGGGCSGLFVLGGCGEGPWLTRRQRAGIVRAAVDAAAGRAPVLAGCLLPGTGPTVEAAMDAVESGAAAIVVGSPYYFGVDAEVQRRHVAAVLAAVDVPLLLYNIPQSTHHALAPETVAALAAEPRVLGIKDSAGDFHAHLRLLDVRRQAPAFKVLQGSEHLMAASLLMGADGLVPGLANVAPALFAALVRSAKAGDTARTRQIQAQVESLWTLHTHGHWLTALKAACAHLDIGNGLTAGLGEATPEQRRRIAEVVDAYGDAIPRPDVAAAASGRPVR